MNESDYKKRSQELKLDTRCPLVGRCERWAWTIYINSYYDPEKETNNSNNCKKFFKEKLLSDFHDREIKIVSEPPEWHKSYGLQWARNICPEIILFTDDSPMALPREAISSYTWSVNEGINEVSDIKHKHFSECLEFIQYKDSQQFEAKTVVENRTINTSSGDYRETNFHDNSRYIETRDNSTYYENYNESQRTLAKAAQEIQNLLKQLEQDNPTASQTEKIDYINDETSKGFKKRVIAALMGGGETAIEEFLDNPYVNIGKALVKGWINPEE